jgi:uracil-DNA glycosylase family protein
MFAPPRYTRHLIRVNASVPLEADPSGEIHSVRDPVVLGGYNHREMPARSRPAGSAAEFLPERRTLPALREASAGCRGCDLWEHATQTVFGEGRVRAKVMLVGEQPGDREDIDGRPFVGPAGKLLDRALEEAGIDRADVYVTNVVKHFKWAPRGKRRIHKKPNWYEMTACRPWLDAELDLVRPKVLVCLGATASQAILGRDFRVTHHRGEFVESNIAPLVTATVHPSSILRARDNESRRLEMKTFVDDLRLVAGAL